MIPYLHDTTDSVEGIGQVIDPSAFLDGRRIAPRRGFVLGSFLVALCLHGYALAVLPSAMEIELEAVEANLANDEIGNDPDVQTNYNVGRIEEVDVPGPPPTLPPPPGFDNGPQGGGVNIDEAGAEIAPNSYRPAIR